VADRRGGTHFEALRRVEPWNPEPLHNVRILPPASCPPILPRARETSTSMLTSEQSNVNPIILHTADSRNLSKAWRPNTLKEFRLFERLKSASLRETNVGEQLGLPEDQTESRKGELYNSSAICKLPLQIWSLRRIEEGHRCR
jgi:hypothetical protein